MVSLFPHTLKVEEIFQRQLKNYRHLRSKENSLLTPTNQHKGEAASTLLGTLLVHLPYKTKNSSTLLLFHVLGFVVTYYIRFS